MNKQKAENILILAVLKFDTKYFVNVKYSIPRTWVNVSIIEVYMKLMEANILMFLTFDYHECVESNF
jgi:hypothetical protein